MRVNMQPLFKTTATKGPVGLKMPQRRGEGEPKRREAWDSGGPRAGKREAG